MARGRRQRLLVLLVAGLALGASTCNWTDFDHLQLETPIRALGRPTDMDSVDYPVFVLPVTNALDATRLLITGANNVALADFSFKPNGDVATETLANRRFVLDGAEVKSLRAAAYVPGADGVPRIAGVTDDERQPILINLDSPQAEFAVTALGSPLPAEANALAVGDATGAGTADIVIVGPALAVLPNGGAGTRVSCDLDPSGSAVAVGAGWVVVSQHDAPGKAVVVQPPFENDVSSKCAHRWEIQAPTSSTAFGTALLIADVDGDGQLEIAVSAPGVSAVYLYRLQDVLDAPQPAGPAEWRTLTTPADAPTATFGTTLAFGAVEGRPTLLVGDPGAADGAGVVWIYAALDAPPTRLDRPNDDVRAFGSQVGVLSFAGASGLVDLVWTSAAATQAGEAGVVYLYYWVTDPAFDPRAL